jgi:3-deoxy-7-phosphoheptulonate synthase
MTAWSPTSWQTKSATQLPSYPDPEHLASAVARLAQFPPLVTSWEIEELKQKLAAASRGEAFLLQGGDCAESFDDCESASITSKLKILLQMSLVMVHGTKTQVIRVGRIAGQYAKPRSTDEETRDGQALPSYRGDLVNRSGFTTEDRTPDPELLIRGYERAALTLNFIRALSEGGFADLHHPEYWDLDFVHHSRLKAEYEAIVQSIRDSLEFMEAVLEAQMSRTQRARFFTSHEGLSLYYEQSQTRRVPRREGWYNLSTHFPWIGMRTAQLDGAHVEYFRGIRNPIAVKVGPGMSGEMLGELLQRLDPDREPGRITLIHRFGADAIDAGLPPLIESVRASGWQPLWCCDPMHGNSETTPKGVKTRRFDKILDELRRAFEIHKTVGSILGGVHFEMTGEDVTECIGGARGLSEDDLAGDYRSTVDPRLNYEQALEMSMLIARHLRGDGW